MVAAAAFVARPVIASRVLRRVSIDSSPGVASSFEKAALTAAILALIVAAGIPLALVLGFAFVPGFTCFPSRKI